MLKSKVQRLCEQRGTTIYRLAEESGVAPDTIYGWRKRGLDGATLGCLLRVARVLDVRVEDLYEEA